MSEDADQMEGCRTCGVFSPLQYNFLRHLFGTYDDTDMESIRNTLDALGVQIHELDGLPQYICTQCILRVEQICNFQRGCLDVQTQLREWYYVDKISMKIKEEKPEDSSTPINREAVDGEDDIIFICVDDLDDFECIPKIIKTEPNDEPYNINNISEEIINEESMAIDTVLDVHHINNNNSPPAINESRTDEINAASSHAPIFTKRRYKKDSWHTVGKKRRRKCSCCEFICISHKQLKKHRRMAHASKTPENDATIHTLQHEAASALSTCRICQTEFLSVTDLNIHMELHNDEEDDTTNSHEQELLEHANYEKEDPRYENHNSDQDVEILLEPIETVDISEAEDKKSFECPICGRTFTLQFSLNRHFKRH